ncbi:hypothetical protein WS68_23530 [Burkholderia sp. TSV86]|nr:hypothetical protein WS68_23530 [Burkholderia sp. TSV86]
MRTPSIQYDLVSELLLGMRLMACTIVRIQLAIVALHRNPGRNWTVAELAAEMDSSRSVFAERFVEAIGMTPARY